MAGGPLDLWNHWGTQVLVLLSLALQVALLLLAGIRRREVSAILKILLWQAYQLADSTAIYVLGHLSFSNAPHEQTRQQLVAFWAPFLLLHLGGPDNITAYALEDAKLWLRHLQSGVVQVLGAAYVIYQHLAGGDDGCLLLAAVLVFAVGVVKYAERTWALRCANLDRIRSSLKKRAPRHNFPRPQDLDSDENFVCHAHSLFHVCKHAIVDSWVEKDPKNSSLMKMLKDLKRKDHKYLWRLMEMELSLMYDLLYTKAGVIHTWQGYCIRVISPIAAAASLLLFQFSPDHGGRGKVDAAVTYTLLAGAFVLETTSLMNALGSTWTYAFLCTTPWKWLHCQTICARRWHGMRRLVKAITGRGASSKTPRRWSGKIGQFNLLHCCSRRGRSGMTLGSLLGIFARKLDYEEWWIRQQYSGTVNFTDHLKGEISKYVLGMTLKGRRQVINQQGVTRMNWGQQAMDNCSKGQLYKTLKGGSSINSNLLGVEFQEGIIIWHIATDVLLARCRNSSGANVEDRVKDIRMLSNYMMFLLVEHPYMLPGLSQSRLYLLSSKNLQDIWDENVPSGSSRNRFTGFKGLFRLNDGPDFAGPEGRDKLATLLFKKNPGYSHGVPRLSHATEVTKLLEKEEMDTKAMLRLLCQVWIDFLMYAANRCSRESHAKKLSTGGELITILWLMTNYLHQNDYAEEPHDGSTV